MPGDRPCSCLLHGKHNGWQWKGRIVPWFVNKYIRSFKYLGLSSRSLWVPLKNHKASFDLLRTLGLGRVSKSYEALAERVSRNSFLLKIFCPQESHPHSNSEEQALHWQVFIPYQILNSWKNAAHRQQSELQGEKTPFSSSSLFWKTLFAIEITLQWYQGLPTESLGSLGPKLFYFELLCCSSWLF